MDETERNIMGETERSIHRERHKHSGGWWSGKRLRWGRLRGRRARLGVDSGGPLAGPLDVHEALHLLPSVLDAQTLPNGVVELVIEDQQTPGRCVLDIHDGQVSHVEPGAAVPWASIAGSHSAWALALGAGEAGGLRLTGEEHLAQRLLAALPAPAIDVRVAERSATA